MNPLERAGAKSRERAWVLGRVGALMRPALRRADGPPEATMANEEPSLDTLRERVERLETMVEGLQDAIYRQSVSQDERIEALQRQLHPDELARTLSADARKRGL